MYWPDWALRCIHHLLLQGTQAYRQGLPAPRHNPRQSMSAVCLACCRAGAAAEEWRRDVLSVEAVLRLTARLRLRPRRTAVPVWPPSAPWLTFLMSNIRPFYESWATEHGADAVTAGNDRDWRVRKLINVGKGAKRPPLGMQSRRAVWINEAAFSFFSPPRIAAESMTV